MELSGIWYLKHVPLGTENSMWVELGNRWRAARSIFAEQEKAILDPMWLALESEQRELLRTARALDREWDTLAIESRAAAYSARFLDFNADDAALARDVGEYRRECTGSLPEAQYRRCVERAAALNARWRGLDGRATRLNAELRRIVSERSAHFERIVRYEQQVLAWQKDLLRFDTAIRTKAKGKKGNVVSIHIHLDRQSGEGTHLFNNHIPNATIAQAQQLLTNVKNSALNMLTEEQRFDFWRAVERASAYLDLPSDGFDRNQPFPFGKEFQNRLDVHIRGKYPYEGR